jgi:hypothetical protein
VVQQKGFTLINFFQKTEASHKAKRQFNKDVTYLSIAAVMAMLLTTFSLPVSASNGAQANKGTILPGNVRKIIFLKHLSHLEPYEQCLIDSAKQSQIPEMLLLSILFQENGRVGKYSTNRDKTKDHGLSQINDVRAQELKPIGLTIDDIRNDGCKSIIAMTYLLSNEYQKAGDMWTAVGNYHYSKYGPYPKHHYKYIKNVHAKWQRLYLTVKQEVSNSGIN